MSQRFAVIILKSSSGYNCVPLFFLSLHSAQGYG
ncbi:hypothetical protein ABIB40_001233, partial [Pedobacter sp. UYP30]